MNSMPPPPTLERSQRQIPSQIEELHGRVQQVEEIMLEIEDRLRPVLANPPEAKTGEGKPTAEEYVPLAMVIQQANNVLSRIKTIQERVLNNLEL